jgi:N-acetylglucosamine-6-phosphate deacetylase
VKIGSLSSVRRTVSIVLGAHLEGPFINPVKPGAMDVSLVLEGDPDLAKSWVNRFNIVVATVAPEIPRGHDVIRALAARGCRVQIGHSIATPDMVAETLRCGCCGFTHPFNAMSAMEHRSPGVAAYAMAKGRFAEIVSDLVHVDATVLLAAYRAIPRLYAITDARPRECPTEIISGAAIGLSEWNAHHAGKRDDAGGERHHNPGLPSGI